MSITNISVVLGQKVEALEVFPDYPEEFDGREGFWGLSDEGKLSLIKDEVLYFNENPPKKPVDMTQPIEAVFVIDDAPYEKALGNEVLLGVYVYYGGDGYGDISHLFTHDASTYEARKEEVRALLESKGLPHDKVSFWVVATPDI